MLIQAANPLLGRDQLRLLGFDGARRIVVQHHVHPVPPAAQLRLQVHLSGGDAPVQRGQGLPQFRAGFRLGQQSHVLTSHCVIAFHLRVILYVSYMPAALAPSGAGPQSPASPPAAGIRRVHDLQHFATLPPVARRQGKGNQFPFGHRWKPRERLRRCFWTRCPASLPLSDSGRDLAVVVGIRTWMAYLSGGGWFIADDGLTCRLCNILQWRDVTGQGGRKLLQNCPFVAFEAPLRERSGAANCIYATGYNPASGARSREWGGGSIHASPRMPCSPRPSALAVITSRPSVASATSRKADSLSGVSKTNSTPGVRPPWSRSAQPEVK